MIFGFNTDIRHEGTIYHVQSEAREAELLLQTQVFVRGRCIGKKAISYAEIASNGSAEQQKEQMLRDQHRHMLDSIRDGRLDEILDKRDTPEALAQIKELKLLWMNSNSVHAEDSLVLRLRVTDGALPAEGAKLLVRLARRDSPYSYSHAATGIDGDAEIRIAATDSSLCDASVLVQAAHAGCTLTRKFQLRKIEA